MPNVGIMNTLMYDWLDHWNFTKYEKVLVEQLVQLEHMRSEIPPAAAWLPILLILTRSKVKTRQSQSFKFLKIAENSNLKFCKKVYAPHPFWSCLIRCINMTRIQPELNALQSRNKMRDGRTDGRTDGQTDGVKPICPPTTSLCRV